MPRATPRKRHGWKSKNRRGPLASTLLERANWLQAKLPAVCKTLSQHCGLEYSSEAAREMLVAVNDVLSL